MNPRINRLPFIGNVADWLRKRHRRKVKIVFDTVLVLFSYAFAYWIRFEGAIPAEQQALFLATWPLLVLTTITSFYLFKVYNDMWRYMSIKDLNSLIAAHAVGLFGFLAIINILPMPPLPRSVLIIYWLEGVLFFGGGHFSFRILLNPNGGKKQNTIRLLVIGAGDAGEMIIRQMKGNAALGYEPIGILDDDTKKRHARIHGVPVLGNIDDLPGLAKAKAVQQIVIAIPSATAAQMRRIFKRCEESRLRFKTVPGPREIINGVVKLSQLRDVKIEDLLERQPVQTDRRQIAGLLSGQVVLVTGACGSIGKEVCRQIMQFNPRQTIMIDRCENELFYLGHEMRSHDAGSYKIVLCDICDPIKLDHIFRCCQPSVVFHAAAYKHVPIMELNPEEAIKNNLGGTMTVAGLAHKHAARAFVLISTDKAVEPYNIMGASKRLAELYVQSLHPSSTKFITVRFGNVLGSNGSVVPLFQKQIAEGGPVTVTDENMTRYFMTIPEAVELILQASAIGQAGEVFVLDMGEPVKVVDMARHLIRLSGLEPDKDIKIEFIGRRPGEKIDEKLWYDTEMPERTDFKKILVSRRNGHDPENIENQLQRILELAQNMQRPAMLEQIRALIPSFAPGENGPVVDCLEGTNTTQNVAEFEPSKENHHESTRLRAAAGDNKVELAHQRSAITLSSC